MNVKNFSALSNLLGSHFHQDWIEEFSNDEQALAAIQEAEPREVIAAACSEIRDIIASNRTDALLDDLLHDELGCYFEPSSRNMTSKEWLAFVETYLAAK